MGRYTRTRSCEERNVLQLKIVRRSRLERTDQAQADSNSRPDQHKHGMHALDDAADRASRIRLLMNLVSSPAAPLPSHGRGRPTARQSISVHAGGLQCQ